MRFGLHHSQKPNLSKYLKNGAKVNVLKAAYKKLPKPKKKVIKKEEDVGRLPSSGKTE